jgi:hypothetical protein
VYWVIIGVPGVVSVLSMADVVHVHSCYAIYTEIPGITGKPIITGRFDQKTIISNYTYYVVLINYVWEQTCVQI